MGEIISTTSCQCGENPPGGLVSGYGIFVDIVNKPDELEATVVSVGCCNSTSSPRAVDSDFAAA